MSALRLDAMVIVNDFAAAAAGIDALSRDDCRCSMPTARCPFVAFGCVIGPGTGWGSPPSPTAIRRGSSRARPGT